MQQRKTLPVINSIDDISEEQLTDLINIGFCYIALPDQDNTNIALGNLNETALNFFRQSKEEKIKFAVNEKFEGFADRQDGKVPQSMQQFYFRSKSPYGPFYKDGESINQIKKVFQDEIGLPLVRKIFARFGKEDCFDELTQQPFNSMSFVYYPETQNIPCKRGVNEHKDFGFITILYITKPGLQVYVNDDWLDVNPKPGYVVINLANALELMLGKKCNSALHRVLLPREERITIALFIDPDMGLKFEKPLVDLMTGETLFKTYKEYVDFQFTRQYEEPKSKKVNFSIWQSGDKIAEEVSQKFTNQF